MHQTGGKHMSLLNLFMLPTHLREKLYNFTRNEKGITAIEYATMAVGLAALLLILTDKGGPVYKALEAAFTSVTDQLKSVK